MNDDDGFVALTKCFYCLDDGDILMNTRPGTENKFIKEVDGKVISMEPCSQCVKYMERGIIIITTRTGEQAGVERDRVEYNTAKERFETEHESYNRYAGLRNKKQMLPFVPNPYRTGVFTVITEEGFRRMSDNLGFPDELRDSVIGKYRWTFLEDTVAELSGLYESIEGGGTKVPFRDQCRAEGKDPFEEAKRLLQESKKCSESAPQN